MKDHFRTKYRELNEQEKFRIDSIKEKADALFHDIDLAQMSDDCFATDPRMIALAKTKLEECVMWAVKSITS